jgi:hypothetical protein
MLHNIAILMLQGLCGSFKESSSEDMFTRWGEEMDNTDEIATSWQQMSQKCQFRKKTKADCNTDEAKIKCDPLRNITGYSKYCIFIIVIV